MDSAKDQLVEKLQAANNILVTVSRDPSVDQLAACIGLTLLLNKFGKHATAVFSGAVPSTIEFLEPESTLEKNTDSLRDFIIALDKSKADKLRYKVEDQMVRIFITPYRTSLSADDLVFSQGDFNVDAVVALGVAEQKDFDEAITSHGRILHDATVIGISIEAQATELGSINWVQTQASSLAEVVTDLCDSLDPNLMDGQIATALLTGIVAQTERFSNEKTTPHTMSVSAALMAAGANQQLVAAKLGAALIPESDTSAPAAASDEPASDTPAEPPADQPAEATPPKEPGTLEIAHDADQPAESNSEPADQPAEETELPESTELPAITPLPQAPVSDDSNDNEVVPRTPHIMLDPPTMGGTLTANSQPEAEEEAVGSIGLMPPEPSPVSGQQDGILIDPPEVNAADVLPPQLDMPEPPAFTPPTPPQPRPYEPVLTGFTPPPPAWVPPSEPLETYEENKTLTEIEQQVASPHLGGAPGDVNDARDEVLRALDNSAPIAPEPIQALNAQPMGAPLHEPDPSSAPQPSGGFTDALAQTIPATPPPAIDQNLPVSPLPDPGLDTTTIPTFVTPGTVAPATQPTVVDPTAPPPVPPPIPFNFGATPPQQ
ncbi:MAG: hypothetical protein JWN38_633 [Candidatus Saccharibacteria bacterium]|nr:hypothetical protein [Candidatus Saccharibacteria bacterium]